MLRTGQTMENQTISFVIPAYIIIRALAQKYPNQKLSISYAPPGLCGGSWYCSTAEESNGIADYFQKEWERRGVRREETTLYMLKRANDGFLIDIRDQSMVICPKEDFPELDGQNKVLIQDEKIFHILEMWEKRNLDQTLIRGGYTKRNWYKTGYQKEEK